MQFPKKVMKISDLVEMGFTASYLTDIYHMPGQRFAVKQNVSNVNSPILFFTDEFGKWLERQIKTQVG